MSARFSLKITTLCHSVRSRGSPDWRSFQRSEVAIRRLTIFWSLWLWRTSGSRPRLPTRITYEGQNPGQYEGQNPGQTYVVDAACLFGPANTYRLAVADGQLKVE